MSERLTDDELHRLSVQCSKIAFNRKRIGYLMEFGYPISGDPRNFVPDFDSCSREEVESWVRAVVAQEDGRKPEPWWGIGMYWYRPEAIDLVCSECGRPLPANQRRGKGSRPASDGGTKEEGNG